MKKILFLLACFVLTSCASKPEIHTYNLESGVHMYYVRSTQLTNKPAYMDVDFNVKGTMDQLLSVEVGFTLGGDKILLYGLPTVSFVLDSGDKIKINEIGTRFIDPVRTKRRFFGLMDPEDYKLLISQSKPQALVQYPENEFVFSPSKQFLRQLANSKLHFLFYFEDMNASFTQ